jgi:uncharacterized membrane protein YgcG
MTTENKPQVNDTETSTAKSVSAPGAAATGADAGAGADAAEQPAAARVWRPVVGVLAAVVIAFCGWSAWRYAQGNDPLAFLGGSALQTVADTGTDATQQITTTSNTAAATNTTTVTADDVCAAAATLAFDGTDVSVASDQVVVVISDGGIWVEQATTDNAASMVETVARRAAALAAWANKQGVGFTHVTWIAEDANGAVRMTVRFACAAAPASGEAQALLSAATGYAISGNAYAELGDSPAFAQSGGETPALPDAAEVPVVSSKTADGEALGESKTTYRVVDENGEEVISKSTTTASAATGEESASGTASNAGSGSGSSAGGSSSDSSASVSGGSSSDNGGASSSYSDAITVTITVDGSSAGAGSSSATLALEPGATVYDALASCGVSFNAKATGYGMYVSSIAGLAEKDHGSMSGWMYSVNGVTAGVACSSYTLSDGDSIYWWYANVEY